MLRAYTISGVKAINSIPSMDRVQFTLNHRTHPSKRNTIKALQELIKCTNADVYVHYDFIYIASRYAMFSEDTRRAIIKEIIAIMLFAENNPQVKGIVMHTDFGLRKEVAKNPTLESIKDAYGSRTWEMDNVLALVTDLSNYTRHNIEEFYDDLKSCWPLKINPKSKVYLENTTKLALSGEGNIQSLREIVQSRGDLLGICYDVEHDFAVNGYEFTGNLEGLFTELQSDGIDFIVHLNTIPEGVEPGSLKDRHSDTTIFECSRVTPQSYFYITDVMDSRSIPYIREVHEDTMYRELKQLEDYGISQ